MTAGKDGIGLTKRLKKGILRKVEQLDTPRKRAAKRGIAQHNLTSKIYNDLPIPLSRYGDVGTSDLREHT